MLTVQADDVGMTVSINQATRQAVELGVIDAASIMVPCPYFDDISSFCAASTDCDWGVHGTLTCEWPQLRWGPVSEGLAVRSLCDSQGYFYSTIDDFKRTATPEAVALELAVQIEVARQRRIQLTYIDCHMYAVYSRPDLMGAYVETARSEGLLALVDGVVFQRALLPLALLQPHCVVIQRTIRHTRSSVPPPNRWHAAYTQQLANVSGMRNQLLLHLGIDDPVARASLGHQNPYGAAWRARDTRFAVSNALARTLRQRGIERCRWSRYATVGGRHQ